MKKILSIALILVLALSAAALSAAALSAAALAETPAYQETVVSIDASNHQIPATICVPTEGENFPAVVMLHGTASNRDEAGGGYKIAAPILAEKYGVATIRIDFMGNGDSTADYMGYTFESAVGDAVAAAEYVKTVEGVNPDAIGVMGWSQGGTDALLCCARHPEIFKSLVAWAGAPELAGNDFFTEENYEDAKKNGYFTMTFDWRDSLNVSLAWCEDVMNTDVLGEFAAFEGPVLAIAGTEDTAVDPEWSNKIVETSKNPDSKTFFIEGMDHTFNVFSEPEFESLLTAVDATGEFFAETLK